MATFSPIRTSLRDPINDRLIGPGRQFEIELVDVNGRPRQVFKGAPRNLAQLYRGAMGFGDKTMVIHGESRHSYDEIFARAAALADTLKSNFDLSSGQHVAIVMRNRPEWIIAVLAVTALGGVAAVINSRGVGEEIERAIETADCRVAIIDTELDEAVIGVAPDPAWRRIVLDRARKPLRSGQDASFDEASTARAGVTFEPIDMSPDDGALILFTSGTTGYPKGALLSHGAVTHAMSVSSVMGALQDLRYEDETGETLPENRRAMKTPTVVIGPLFHLSGMMPVLRSIGTGVTIHMMTKWNVDTAIDMIEREGMSRLAFVPAMLWDLLRSPRATPEVLGEIRYMMNGAAALDPRLLEEIERRMPHCLFANTYGQTEDTGWACSISGRTYLEHPDSCGWPCPTVDLVIRRDDGSEAALGEPGEIWVSSAGLMTGYFGDASATAETLQDGWLATGDIGTVDERGMIRVVDRKKSMVISGGENIYCAEVERVVAGFAGVREVIAYGRPDERLGERLAVTVVLEGETAPDAQAIKDYCKQHLAIYKVPRDVSFMRGLLPRTHTGKVDRGTFLRSLQS